MNNILKKNINLIVIIGVLIFTASIISGIFIYKQLDNPELCRSCHEMLPYYNSYIKPQNGSLMLSHNLTCIQCHSNKNLGEARKKVAIEIILYKFNISRLTSFDELRPDCTICHIPKSPVHIDSNPSNCTACHWAHLKLDTSMTPNISLHSIIQYGPHKNKICQDCHGKDFKIPRCINCHSGHGNQELENKLCLECHSDPHIPKIPGIFKNNTVYFKQELPFSICEPCHESQYTNMTYMYTGHTDMGTCTKCHQYHGEKPKCSKCHQGMLLDRHPSDFNCKTCHATLEGGIRITCQDCHGTSHEWGKLTAIINPK